MGELKVWIKSLLETDTEPEDTVVGSAWKERYHQHQGKYAESMIWNVGNTYLANYV